MSADANTKYVSVKHPVPRDPSRYEPTTHFGQRLRERVHPASRRSDLVDQVIRNGTCRGISPPDHGPDDAVLQHFAFEHELYFDEWTIIVGIKETAFRDGDTNHLAITIYPNDDE